MTVTEIERKRERVTHTHITSKDIKIERDRAKKN